MYGLDIILEEDARDVALAYDVRLLGDAVLVGEERAVRVGRSRVDRVDGGDDGEEVLELVEVVWGGGDGSVEGVDELGVEVSEGEFVDDVREVEGWNDTKRSVSKYCIKTVQKWGMGSGLPLCSKCAPHS